jgi:hypothetical protein
MPRYFDQEGDFEEVSPVHTPLFANDGDKYRVRVPESPKDKAMNDVIRALRDRRAARAALGAEVMRTELSLPHGSSNGPRYRPQAVEHERAVQEAEERLNAALQALEDAL